MRYFLYDGRVKLSDLLFPYYINRKIIYDFIKSVANDVAENMTLLDFGCGSMPYKSLFKCQKYIGCDIERSGHDETDKVADVFYDGHNLPFPDNSFDYILVSEVFEHVSNIDEILEELKRIMKSSGKMFITIPFCLEEHEQPYDFRRFTSYGLRTFLEAHELKCEYLWKSSSYKTTIRFMKIMRWDNVYRNAHSLPNRLVRILVTFANNCMFVLSRKQDNYDDNTSIGLFAIAQK